MTRIAHLSDLHLLEDNWQRRTGMDRYRLSFLCAGVELDAGDRRKKALAALRRAKHKHVDHVLITGDLTEDGTTEQYEVLAEVLEESGLSAERVTLVPGNHDAYAQPDAWRLALEGPLSAYRSTSAAGTRIVLDEAVIEPISTVMEGQPFTRAAGVMRRDSIDTVMRTMSDGVARGKAFIVAQHHSPLGMRNPMWNWFDGTMETRPMRALLEDRPGLHVVHGHVHRSTTIKFHGRPAAQVFSVQSVRDGEAPIRVYRAEDGELHAEGESNGGPLQASPVRTLQAAMA